MVQISTMNWKNGQREGEQEWWSENGVKLSSIFWKNNQLDGNNLFEELQWLGLRFSSCFWKEVGEAGWP